jgi:hypothetical protein
MMKTMPVLLPSPLRPNVSWQLFMALMAPIKEES